ncbi:hypothetical protein LEP1GSC111_3087 [Leptospira interrogans str. UT126]|nr:hypothetical protein LEP1GSC111_3087 [Leptospira interrogans str. UT126]
MAILLNKILTDVSFQNQILTGQDLRLNEFKKTDYKSVLTKRFFNIHKNQIEEYVSLNLGDKRLDKRLKKIVSVMTKRGGTSLPDRFGNWSGAYRFFKSESIL